MLEGDKIISASRLEWNTNTGWPTAAQFKIIRARPPLTPLQLQVVESAFQKAKSGHTYKNHPISRLGTLWRFITPVREYHVGFESLHSRDGHSGPLVSICVKCADASWLDDESEYEVEGDEARRLTDLLDDLD